MDEDSLSGYASITEKIDDSFETKKSPVQKRAKKTKSVKSQNKTNKKKQENASSKEKFKNKVLLDVKETKRKKTLKSKFPIASVPPTDKPNLDSTENSAIKSSLKRIINDTLIEILK